MPRTLSDEDCDAIVQKLLGRLALDLARAESEPVGKDKKAATPVQKQKEPTVSSSSVRYPKYVRGRELLNFLWGPESRPSPRWLDLMKKRRVIPFVKVGHSVFFDPIEVQTALKRFEIRSKC